MFTGKVFGFVFLAGIDLNFGVFWGRSGRMNLFKSASKYSSRNAVTESSRLKY